MFSAQGFGYCGPLHTPQKLESLVEDLVGLRISKEGLDVLGCPSDAMCAISSIVFTITHF